MRNKNKLLPNYIVLPIAIVIFVSFTFLYAIYQYLIFFLLMLASLGVMIYLAEKAFGYPEPMIYELKNRTIEDARINISTLISLAKQEILIVSGTLDHHIYANEEIINLFKNLSKEIKNRNISLKVYVTEETIDQKSVSFVKFLQEVDVPIQRIDFRRREKIKHFIIVDSQHVRLEKNHKPISGNRKAVLRLQTPYLARKVKKFFNDVIKVDTIEILDPNIIINQMTGGE